MEHFLISYGLFSMFAALALGGIFSVLFSRANEKAASTMAHFAAAVGSLFGLGFGLAVLIEGVVVPFHMLGQFGILGDFVSLRVDGLSAFFISLISIVAL